MSNDFIDLDKQLINDLFSKKINSTKMLKLLSVVFSRFKVEYDVLKINLNEFGYHSRLKCLVFPLHFIRPKTELFAFLENLKLTTQIFLYVDQQLNFNSIEFNYRLEMSPLVNGVKSFYSTDIFSISIQYDNNFLIDCLWYKNLNGNQSNLVVKNNSMLCPLNEESQLIEIFFQNQNEIASIFPFFYNVGVYNYQQIDFEKSLDLIRMMNI